MCAKPVVSSGDKKLNFGDQVLATSLFTASDADGDVFSRFRFMDVNGALNLGGSFFVDGSQVLSSDWFEVDLADINRVFFHAANNFYTENVRVQVYDGTNWSNVGNIGIYSGTNNDSGPSLTVSRPTVLENETMDVFSFVTYSDANNDPVVRFRMKDNRDDSSSAGSGYFVKNGVRQIQTEWFYFTASDSVHYVAAPGQYEEGIQVRAFDGVFWTDPYNSSIKTYRNSNRPGVAPTEVVVRSGYETAITSLFSAFDEDGNTIKTYSFRDTHSLGGHLLYNGQVVAAKTWLTVNADQLSDLSFVGADSKWTEILYVRVNDGKFNSNLGTVRIESVTAPTIDTSNMLLDDLSGVQVRPLVSQTDNGPLITKYNIIHDAEPNSTGFFALGGLRLQEGVQYSVTTQEFRTLVFRSGVYETPSLDNLLIQADNGYFVSDWERMVFRTEAEHYSSLIINYGTPNELSWKQFIPGEPLVLTYSFFNVYEPGYQGAEVNGDNFVSFGTVERASVREMVGELASFLNVEFVEVAADSTSIYGNMGGELRFGGMFIEDTDYAAFAYLPGDPVTNVLGGDVWVNYWNTSGFAPGGFGYNAILHEIGHTMGLKHPHEAPATLPRVTDNAWHSVMTYNFDRQWARDYGVYDVLSLQRLYGSNTAYNADDTVYSYRADPAAPQFISIWDTAGNDTLDLSSYNRFMQVDLREGSSSQVFGTGFFRDDLTGAPLNSENFNITFGTQIENVIAGRGNDNLGGNEWNNNIEGRAGNDTIRGLGGNDLLMGGANDDTYIWGLGDGHDRIDEQGMAGRDRLVVETRYTGIDDFSEDISFSRLNDRDLLIEFLIDGSGQALGSVLIDYQQGSSRIETLVLEGMAGGDVMVDLTTFIASLGSERTSMTLTGSSSAFGQIAVIA